jgi:hypothetical protein
MYSVLLKHEEWSGSSYCDVLVNAYIPFILHDANQLTPLESAQVRSCLDKRVYALVARSVVGIPTLPLNIFYDFGMMAQFTMDVGIAGYVIINLPLNTTSYSAYKAFMNANIDPIMGTKLYDAFWNITQTIKSSFSFTGIMDSVANALDKASPTLGDPVRSLTNSTLTILDSTFHNSTATMNVYDAMVSLRSVARTIATLNANGKRQASTRRVLQFRESQPTNAIVETQHREYTHGRELKSIESDVVHFFDPFVSQCGVLEDVFMNAVNATVQVVNYYRNTFKKHVICNFVKSFNAIEHDYDGFARRQGCGGLRSGDPRVSLTTVVFEYLNVADFGSLFTGSTRDLNESYIPPVKTKYNISSVFVPSLDLNQTTSKDTGGFTHQVGRYVAWVGVDVFDYASKIVNLMTSVPSAEGSSGADSHNWFWQFYYRLTVCDYEYTMECSAVNTAGLLKGLVMCAIYVTIVVWLVMTYVPKELLIPVMALCTIAIPILIIMLILFVAYGESPNCFFKTYGSPIVMIPYCILDDLYDFIDIYVFPRHIQWGDTLVQRHTSDFSLVDATNATLCTTTYGFVDGFHNIGYGVQRIFGNGYLDKHTWARYISIYPFNIILNAFQDVTLESGDVYEDCFWITIVNIIPAFMLMGVLFVGELALLYVGWAILSSSNIFIRDVRNTAIMYGLLNDDWKEAYVGEETLPT